MSAGELQVANHPEPRTAWLPSLSREASTWFGRYRVTVIASAIAILAYVFPTLATGLQLDFASVAGGQWWRLVSGHLTHFDGQHLFWDLLMFVVLGAACERHHSRLYGVSLLVMALGISATVTLFSSDVTGYRGLSGIDTGLYVWFICDQIRRCLAERDRTWAGFWAATGMLLVGKLIYEFVTGEVLFVDSEGFKPLIESHLAGAAIGACFAAVGIRTKTTEAAHLSIAGAAR